MFYFYLFHFGFKTRKKTATKFVTISALLLHFSKVFFFILFGRLSAAAVKWSLCLGQGSMSLQIKLAIAAVLKVN